MSLGSDISAALPFLRSQAESMMVDVCVVTRGTSSALDETTGEYTPTSEVIYSGPCKFKAANTQVHPFDLQGQQLIESSATLSLPVGAPGSVDVRDDDIAVVTFVRHDPTAPQLRARITSAPFQSFTTARRFPVEVVA